MTQSRLLPVLLFTALSCNRQQEKIKPVIEDVTESVYASGIVKSNDQYEVFSSVNGIAAKWMVKEGDPVARDQPVLHVSGVAAQLQAEQARIAAQNASRSANMQKLEQLRVEIDQAKARMDQDAVQLQRQRNLWTQHIGSRNELDQRELAWKTSSNNYQAAGLRYQDLQREIDFGEKQANKNLEISKAVAGDYTVKSERGGRLYSRLVEEGEMVSMQQPVAVIGDAISFLLELQVDEYDIARIRPGQKIAVSMDSYIGKVFEAEVTKIRPFMHERSKTFTVEARFLQPPDVLYPNLTCEANIVIARKAKALTIPRSCLLDGGYVLMPDNKKRKVTAGLMDYQKVEVTGGLTVNDVILKPAP